MKILIVDDSIAKIADIVALIRHESATFEVETCSDCISALSKLSQKFDLILLDLYLPLRSGDNPTKNGGKYIVDQITRDSKLQAPTYILCLSQFDELVEDFHPIWRTIKYDQTKIEWKVIIYEFLTYISRQHSKEVVSNLEKKPTIFVEGKTDQKIFKSALTIFFPNYENKLIIESEASAGANWVTRKLIVWGFALIKDKNDRYIRAAGIFDKDPAGKEAVEQLNRQVQSNSAESQCIKAFKYSTNHAKHLIPLYAKGIKIPITLEEMIPYDFWSYAHSNNWLVDRNNVDAFLRDPSKWEKRTKSLNEHIHDLGFTAEEDIFLSKINNDNKIDFCNYILGLEEENKKIALQCFQPLLKDIIHYLFPDKE